MLKPILTISIQFFNTFFTLAVVVYYTLKIRFAILIVHLLSKAGDLRSCNTNK